MSALTNRDTNDQSQPSPFETKKPEVSGGENMSQKSQMHKSVLDQKSDESNGSGTYVSPSDAIMSPASQKLSSFKQRQINKQNGIDPARRSLFARTVSANSDKANNPSSSTADQSS